MGLMFSSMSSPLYDDVWFVRVSPRRLVVTLANAVTQQL